MWDEGTAEGNERGVVYLLPGPIWNQERGMADMAADVVEPPVIREGAVPTVMPDHEQTPHEESWGWEERMV